MLAILTGKSDLCISGVFGASVNRAAVALTGGLLLMDPDLKIMVMTKENAAAQAFAVHLLSLGLPSSVTQRASRRVKDLPAKLRWTSNRVSGTKRNGC